MSFSMHSLKTRTLVVRLLVLLILAVGAIFVTAPLLWMVRTSLMNKDSTETFPPKVLPMEAKQVQIGDRSYYIYAIPVDGQTRELALFQKKGPVGVFVNPENPQESYEIPVQNGERVFNITLRFENYLRILRPMPGTASFSQYIVNSLMFVIPNVIGTVISSLVVAYGFARFRARGMGVLFLLLLSTIMLPGAVTLIPTFIMFSKIGWYNSLLPLIIPAYFGNPWHIFWLRQYFMTLPLELDDAAKIDGCGTLGILWHVILPQSKPALATVAIFQGLWAWNEFFLPLIYLKDMDKWTVANGLQIFSSRYGGSGRDQPGMMAASTVVVLPVILTFFFAQRLFIQGTVVSGIKG